MYAVKGEIDLNSYELPPVPPSEVFDIRYESNRNAENINGAFKTIQMTAIEYPIRIKVENMDIRLQDEKAKRIKVNLKSGEDIVISDATITKLMVSGELIPAVFALEQNYPNPFNPSTTIKYGLKERSFVELKVYDILGREVASLINEAKDAGYYEIDFNAAKLSSGVYLYQLKAGQFIETKKMLLLK